jgi:exosortase
LQTRASPDLQFEPASIVVHEVQQSLSLMWRLQQEVSARSLFWPLVIGGIICFLYTDVVAGLITDWFEDPSASHGFLIPPLAIYVAWFRRDRVFSFPAVADPRGVWLTLTACILFLLGKLGVEYFLMRASLVVLMAGLTWTFWGLPRFRALLFSFLLLLTMIPLPALLYNQLTVPLQLFASYVSARAVQFLGLTVYLDGNILHLPQLSLGVAEACSGLRSLSSLVVLALLLGFLQKGSRRFRLALLALSVPIAVAVNVVRIVGTASLVEHDERFAMGFYHAFSGWLIFVLGIGMLWITSRTLAKVL